MKNNMKIGIITSPGAHLRLLLNLKDAWSLQSRFWVTHKLVKKTGELEGEKIYYGFFPENRNLINFIRNIFLAIKILNKERPKILISGGAGVAVPFFWVGYLFGCRLVFIEPFGLKPKPTLSGRLVYRLCKRFYVQDSNLKKIYPKARFSKIIV